MKTKSLRRYRVEVSSVAIAILLAGWRAEAQGWPQFRGAGAGGVADGQDLPIAWNVESGQNVRWSAVIPGLGHSSPIVWGDRVFVTTAVAQAAKEPVLGDDGGIALAGDRGEHSWRLYCLDRESGEVLWWKEAFSGSPRADRHVKASQANATPATDGRFVAAIFGSQGLAVYDLAGEPRWKADLGVLDPGLYGDKTSHWGHSSSPVIADGLVFAQVDRHAGSFVAAYELETGKEVWRVGRDEKPVWATPTIRKTAERTELIVVGGEFDRGYDAKTGKELWRYPRDEQVKTPTPFVAGDRLILAGGYRGKPLHALPLGASGEVSALWTSEPGGPYTSTPVAYGDAVFFVRDIGVLTVLSLASGERLHQARTESTYSASPVASDGKVYLTGEEGVVTVVRAEPDFAVLAANDMGEPCMASPAIAAKTLFVRCRSKLWAIGKPGGSAANAP